MHEKDKAVYDSVGRILSLGLWSSAALIFCGLIAGMFSAGAGAFLLRAGIATLALTPPARVIAAGLAYQKAGKPKYALISLAIILLLSAEFVAVK